MADDSSERGVEEGGFEAGLSRAMPRESFLHWIEGAPFGILVVDAAFRLSLVSAGGQKAFSGVRPLIGRDFAEVLRCVWEEPFATEAIGRFQHTLATGEPYGSPNTTKHRANTDEVESYDWRIQRVRMPNGDPAVVCWFVDLTERLESEAIVALAAALDRFRVRLSDALRPLVDPIEVQAAASRVLGEHLGADRALYFEVDGTDFVVERDYVSGSPSLRGRFPIASYGDRLIETLRSSQTVVENDVANNGDLPTAVRTAFADIGIAAHIGVPLIKNGTLVAGLAVQSRTPRIWTTAEVALVQEVAERTWSAVEQARVEVALRRSEGRFRVAVGAVSSLIWTNNAEGEMEGEQPGWGNFTGQSQEEYQGFGWARAVHPEDAQPTIDAWNKSVAREQTFVFEHRVRRRDGAWRLCAIRAVPVRDTAGVIREWVGVHTDITDRIESEEALREAKERAESASRAKDDFLAQLSHELRTPLTPVLMTAAALCEDERLPEDVREQLAMVERNVALEARLIDDLLDLTRITSGKFSLHTEHCDMHALIRMALEIVREEARDKRIQIAVDLESQRSHLHGDPARLQQVFWNLLRNAVKFTPAGGHIRVRSSDGGCVTEDGDDSRRVCVEVIDDGIGFQPDEAEELFRPFHQGRQGQASGLGLGLAIARKIVNLHEGVLEGASEGEGKGATFKVELPSADAAGASTGDKGGETNSGDAGPEPALRLLLVEDDATTLRVLQRLLSKAGHQITTATSVSEAIAIAERETFDFLISDVGLPDGTGMELMRRLKSSQGLKGIALSGYGMEDDLKRSQEAGFVAHLVKPIDIDELRSVLRKVADASL